MASTPDFAVDMVARYLSRRRGSVSGAGLRSVGRRHFEDPPRAAAILSVGAVRCTRTDFFRIFTPDGYMTRFIRAYNAYRGWEDRQVPDVCGTYTPPAMCDGRGCGPDGAGGSCGECATGYTCDAHGRCAPPAVSCARDVDVVIYHQGGWSVTAEAFKRAENPCANYFLSIAPNTPAEPPPDATGNPNALRCVRGGVDAQQIRRRGAHFHAMAEYHWSGKPDCAYPGWSNDGRDWYARGVEFRARMEAGGFRAAEGDIWAINEFPSTTRTNQILRRNIQDLVRGLFDGPPGSPHVQGAIFMTGVPQTPPSVGYGRYHQRLADWLQDDAFWQDMNRYVRSWGMEVYGDPQRACAGGDIAAQSHDVQAYALHPVNLAIAGGSRTAAARAFFDRAYTPTLNAVFGGEHYFTTSLTADQMEHFVSLQTYAARSWVQNDTGRVRIGFGFDHASNPAIDVRIATRMAESIRDAYAPGGGSAARACNASGAVEGCLCQARGSARIDAWDAFSSW